MIQDLSRDEVDRIMNTLKKEKGKQFFQVPKFLSLIKVVFGKGTQFALNKLLRMFKVHDQYLE
jgi:hypothetical protein